MRDQHYHEVEFFRHKIEKEINGKIDVVDFNKALFANVLSERNQDETHKSYQSMRYCPANHRLV